MSWGFLVGECGLDSWVWNLALFGSVCILLRRDMGCEVMAFVLGRRDLDFQP